jgi:hypothetical protein
MLHGIPGSILSEHQRIAYDFSCEVLEDVPNSRSRNVDLSAETVILPSFLRFKYPLQHLEVTQVLLGHILRGTDVTDDEKAKQIYLWIVHNLSYSHNILPDYSVLTTGSGTCIQLTRLFINLLRLLGIPAREQCGALITRGNSHIEVSTVSWVHSPFAHTWAEVFSTLRGWYSVDFIVMGYGNWLLTPLNASPSLRGEIGAHANDFLDYYFGGLDPHRIHTHRLASALVPIGASDETPRGEMLHELLRSIRHELTCSFEVST